jgi:MFS family permease
LNTAAILLLMATGDIRPAYVFGAVAIQGMSWTLEQPLRRTAMFDIAGPGRLVSALALDTIASTLGKMCGPLAAGALMGGLGFTSAYGFALAFQLAALGLLFKVRIPYNRTAPQREPAWTSLVEATRFALGNSTLMAVILFTLVMNGVAFPAQQFVPAVGRDHLGVGAALVGLLSAAEGFGQLLGAAAMASMRRVGSSGTIFAAGSLVILAIYVTFVWSPWYPLTWAMLAAAGVGMAAYGTMQNSITLLASPPEMRGRMLGVLNVCIGISTPVGALEMGALAAAFATRWTISLNAVAGLLMLIPVLLLTPIASRSGHETRPQRRPS